MQLDNNAQFGRKASLLLVNASSTLDVSDLRFKFEINAMDVESPTNASIRVYNMSEGTAQSVRKEFTEVVVQAGYSGNFGVIFRGTIKQFRKGRENATDTYLDILAADGDIAYNYSVVNRTLAAGSSAEQRIDAAVAAMQPNGVAKGTYVLPNTAGTLPRGKVLFGLAKAALRAQTQNIGATWSIDGGKVNVVGLLGYLPGKSVVLNGQTGLVGRPEQTIDGIRARCLMNPKLVVGGTVQIDNKAINQTLQQDPNAAPIPFNQWVGLQQIADLASDGIYRIFVVEYKGDTRGQDWYCDLTLLAVNSANKEVIAKQ